MFIISLYLFILITSELDWSAESHVRDETKRKLVAWV